MGWWITIGILTLLAILPLGVRISYDAGGPLVKLVLGPVGLTVFPRPKKEKKPGMFAQAMAQSGGMPPAM